MPGVGRGDFGSALGSGAEPGGFGPAGTGCVEGCFSVSIGYEYTAQVGAAQGRRFSDLARRWEYYDRRRGLLAIAILVILIGDEHVQFG